MGLLRPGTRIRFWNPRFRNKPSVRPPGLLILISIGFLLSAIGVPVYAAFATLGHAGGSPELMRAVYIAAMHFLLPLGIAYTVCTNSPLSRSLIGIYVSVLTIATGMGKGLLGEIDVQPGIRLAASIGVLGAALMWLYASSKMRLYYILLLEKPVPERLKPKVSTLTEGSALSPKVSLALEWFADHLETVVLLGFTIIAVYALIQLGFQ